MKTFNKVKLQELWNIFVRNVFLLTNGIIFSVVVLLLTFGQTRAGIFLGIISLLNIIAGLFQDIRAWRGLERLQLLTAPHVTRVNADGTETSVLTEEIMKGDNIKLKIGDQVPCDGVLINALGLEINEGLITGESNSLPREKGANLLAGSIVTAGSGNMQTSSVFRESRIARMTEGIKKHSLTASPIQQAANLVVQYAGYALILAIIYVIGRGIILRIPIADIVLNIGTLASMLVPQGLVFTITLFFAYGAANMYGKNVLLQEINATEKLGRIKNLCMDKTGTLTENVLTVDDMYVPPGVTKEIAGNLMASYIQGTGDVSQITLAVKNFLKDSKPLPITDAQPFSSWRQYGSVHLKTDSEEFFVLVGSPDVFLSHLSEGEQKKWLSEFLQSHADGGKHALCVVKSDGSDKDSKTDGLSVIAVFMLHNDMREGILQTVNFFQNRGVHIRIISGDNPETVLTVAKAAGVKNTDKIITGHEMAAWTESDYKNNSKLYSIFARIVPEQKEKIIEALKLDGFTAMVGDGANDALAIKKSDLGIAMFDGAPATRQLASIVLVNNNFTALPGGVELADDIIGNIEIFSSVFFNQTLIGLFLFALLSVFGITYPLTPFNVTLINYFTINLPGLLLSIWTIRPTGKAVPVSLQPFLRRVLPFAAWSAGFQTIGVALIFALNAVYFKISPSNTLTVFVFSALSFAFFAFAPSVYQGIQTRTKKLQILSAAVAAPILIYLIFKVPFFVSFFNVTPFRLPFINIIQILSILVFFCIIQFIVSTRFIKRNNKIVPQG